MVSSVSFLNQRTLVLYFKRTLNLFFKNVAQFPLNTLYVDYNKMPMKLYGMIVIPISSNGWKVTAASFLGSKNVVRNLLDLNLHRYYPNKEDINCQTKRTENISSPVSGYWRHHFTKRNTHVIERLGH